MQSRFNQLVRSFLLSENHPQLVADLFYVFNAFPVESLRHLGANLHRLKRGVFVDKDGGCIFYLLSEQLKNPIDRREKLTRWFTGGNGRPYCEYPEYQPARYLVRQWDNIPQKRYGFQKVLRYSTVRIAARVALLNRLCNVETFESTEPCSKELLAEYQLDTTPTTRFAALVQLEEDLGEMCVALAS